MVETGELVRFQIIQVYLGHVKKFGLYPKCNMNPPNRFKQGSKSNLYFFIFTFSNDCSSNSVENGMKGQEGQLESCFHKSIAECMMNI